VDSIFVLWMGLVEVRLWSSWGLVSTVEELWREWPQLVLCSFDCVPPMVPIPGSGISNPVSLGEVRGWESHCS
jgi:hypothetical protein